MSFKLGFLQSAAKNWQELDNSIKILFRKKLKERLENPRVQKDKLRDFKDVYKIKLRKVGFRLAYQVKDDELIVLVLVVGKRADNEVYEKLKEVFNQLDGF